MCSSWMGFCRRKKPASAEIGAHGRTGSESGRAATGRRRSGASFGARGEGPAGLCGGNISDRDLLIILVTGGGVNPDYRGVR